MVKQVSHTNCDQAGGSGWQCLCDWILNRGLHLLLVLRMVMSHWKQEAPNVNLLSSIHVLITPEIIGNV
jgi:hypothetical protein